MVKNKIEISKDLLTDLQKYSATVAISLATQVRDEMNTTAQKAIEDFYNHYRPKNGEPLYYKRHYYNFRKKSFTKYYKNPHNSIIRGGVELTPYNLDDVYRADTEYVFNLVYLGYHGNVGMFPHHVTNVPPVMSPNPLDILLDKRNEIIKNINEYKEYAIEKANKETYDMLNI